MVPGIERTPPSSSRDGDELRAFFGLERRLLELLSTRVVRCTHGVAYLDDDFPTRYYSNFLLADRGLEDATADFLIEEADEVLEDRAHRRIRVRDEGEVPERSAEMFAQRGFEASREVVMRHARSPDRAGPLAVEELPFDGVSSLILETYEEDAASDQDFTQQHRKFERAIGARFFASRVDGELAGLCELHRNGVDAMVENVVTLERFRGRGVARSIVLRAIEAARDAGAARVFIVADDEDWPKELYARLGFDAIGQERIFTKAPI
jgi:N-acetylglutamate synthase-like GNAT family acetyltransferase